MPTFLTPPSLPFRRLCRLQSELSYVLFNVVNQPQPRATSLSSIPPLLDEVAVAERHATYEMENSQGRMIWKSALSMVQEVTRSEDQQPCVVKMIRKSNVRKLASVVNLGREISILKKLDHPFVIPIIDLWHEPDYVCMVFKLHKQDLFGLSNGFETGMPDGERAQ